MLGSVTIVNIGQKTAGKPAFNLLLEPPPGLLVKSPERTFGGTGMTAISIGENRKAARVTA
jgi:hypothetical protein